MSEDKKIENDAKAKMLAALAKKQKGNTTGKVLALPQAPRLALVKQEALRQRCTAVNQALHNQI